MSLVEKIVFIVLNIQLATLTLGQADRRICTDEFVCNTGIKTYPHVYSEFCSPCKCNQSCSEDTLCHLPKMSIYEANAAKCKHQYNFLNKTDILQNFAPYLRRMYYVIAQCPPDASIEDKDRCETSETFEDVHYVSGTTSLKIYKNTVCAKCNGEHTYVKWRHAVGLSSEEIENVTLGNMGFYSELKKRDIISVPPVGYPEALNECQPSDINKCNVTGQWVTYDENINRLCNYNLYVPVVINTRIAYKNVYCALCNKDENLLCTILALTHKDVGNVPLTSLLIWKEDSMLNEEHENKNMCSDNEIIDPLENVCRRIRCPFGQYTIRGSCNKGHIALWDISVHVFLKTAIEEDLFANVSELQVKNDMVYFSSQQEVCRPCNNLNCFKIEEEKSVVCSMWFPATYMCNMNTLIEFLSPTATSKFSVKVPVHINNEETVNLTFYNTFSNTFPKTDSKCNGFPTWDLQQKYYCPSIVVPYSTIIKIIEFGLEDEFKALSEEFIPDDEQPSWIHHNASRVICISDYFKIVNQMIGSNSCHSVTNIKIYIHLTLIITFVVSI